MDVCVYDVGICLVDPHSAILMLRLYEYLVFELQMFKVCAVLEICVLYFSVLYVGDDEPGVCQRHHSDVGDAYSLLLALLKENLCVLLQTNDERAKAQGITVFQNSQQQGNKNVESARTQNVVNPGLTKAMATMDEFKSGFPSEGLSATSNKWWGNRDHDDCAGTNASGANSQPKEKAGEDKVVHESEKTVKHLMVHLY
ncbi:hypothetical protein VNO80_30423 [Phaseolus coccineus]|uniref:Uncharacterized protein n=1 Tax=Phaseolus coccineus TaxID=3886 RepID=A0AAN9LD74_PHACN